MATEEIVGDLESERIFRRELERRLEAQIRIGRILAEPLAFHDAAPRLLEAIAEPFGWTLAAIWTFTTDFSRLRCEAVWTAPGEPYEEFVARSRGLEIAPGDGLPGRVFDTNAPARLADLFDETSPPRTKEARAAGLREGLALPIRTEGRIVGVLELLAHDAPAGYHLIEATGALSHQLAPFLERQRAERRLELVSEASRRLGETLDEDRLAKTAAELVTPELADWCAVWLLEPDGLRLAAAFPESSAADAVEASKLTLAGRAPSTELPSILRTTTTDFLELDDGAAPLGSRIALAAFQLASLAAIPLVAGETPLGLLVAAVRPPRRIRETKLPLLEELARRASAALQNARLFRRTEQLVEAVDSERRRLDRLVENVPGVVWESWRHPDPGKHRVDFVSRHIEEMLGRPAGDFLSSRRFWLSAVHPEDRDRMASEIRRVYRHGRHSSRFRWIGARGDVIWVDARTVLIRDRDGTALGLRGVVFDVTHLKRIEDALAMKIDELGRSNAELAQFAYAASHDLQEPLRTITSFAQVLERRHGPELPAGAREYLSQIADGAVRMQTLIRELLAFSRIGRGEEVALPVPLDTALDEALRNLAAAISDSGAEIIRQPLPTIVGRHRELVQLFQNLVGNALKFRTDAAPRITISGTPVPGFAEIAVADNGIGIPASSHEKVFTLFRRLHDRRETPGAGIGLALCRKIVESHGGRIRFVSEPGRGSTFYFSLPRS